MARPLQRPTNASPRYTPPVSVVCRIELPAGPCRTARSSTVTSVGSAVTRSADGSTRKATDFIICMVAAGTSARMCALSSAA